jgi:hypothetical protein
MYNDPSYVLQVANVNNLVTIRKIAPPMGIYFPPFAQTQTPAQASTQTPAQASTQTPAQASTQTPTPTQTNT